MEEKNKNNNLNSDQVLIEEMMKSGVHYGRAKRWTHPSIRPFLLKSNKNIELFNLKLTLAKINEVINFLRRTLEDNKTILFVGVTPAAQSKIREIAVDLKQPYVNYKWVAGLLTNFQTVQARLIYFRELLKKESEGELEKYLPKEKSRLEKELQKLKNFYAGLADLEKLPDVVFIVNLSYKQHQTAVRESLKMKIPIVAIAGSDNNIQNIKFFIPANDKAPKSIAFLIDVLKKALKIDKIEPESNK